MSNTQSNTFSREKIARDLADSEQRQLFVAAQIKSGLPLQLRAMREERGWTQAKLAEKLGTTQNTVSRLENPKTSKPTITTLKRIAEAFDVALVVKFFPFSQFIDLIGGMSRKSVAVPSYDAELADIKEEGSRVIEEKEAPVAASSLPAVFGALDQIAKTSAEVMSTIEQHTAITVPWAQAKIMAYYLTANVVLRETENGQIHLPNRVVPPKPDPVEAQASGADPKIAAYMAWVHEQFFGSNPYVPPEVAAYDQKPEERAG